METYTREQAERLGAFEETALSEEEALAAEVLTSCDEPPADCH